MKFKDAVSVGKRQRAGPNEFTLKIVIKRIFGSHFTFMDLGSKTDCARDREGDALLGEVLAEQDTHCAFLNSATESLDGLLHSVHGGDAVDHTLAVLVLHAVPLLMPS